MQDLNSLESQLLLTSSSLFQQLSQLKQQKLKYTIQKFEQDERKQMQSELNKQFIQFDEELKQGKATISAQLSDRQSKIEKAIEQSQKQIDMYMLLLEDLKSRKENVERNYSQAVTELTGRKEKCVSEWRRTANDYIKKSAKLV